VEKGFYIFASQHSLTSLSLQILLAFSLRVLRKTIGQVLGYRLLCSQQRFRCHNRFRVLLGIVVRTVGMRETCVLQSIGCLHQATPFTLSRPKALLVQTRSRCWFDVCCQFLATGRVPHRLRVLHPVTNSKNHSTKFPGLKSTLVEIPFHLLPGRYNRVFYIQLLALKTIPQSFRVSNPR
jgi:hypothetical protein